MEVRKRRRASQEQRRSVDAGLGEVEDLDEKIWSASSGPGGFETGMQTLWMDHGYCEEPDVVHSRISYCRPSQIALYGVGFRHGYKGPTFLKFLRYLHSRTKYNILDFFHCAFNCIFTWIYTDKYRALPVYITWVLCGQLTLSPAYISQNQSCARRGWNMGKNFNKFCRIVIFLKNGNLQL